MLSREAFWARFKRVGGCLEWQGSRTSEGYGMVIISGVRVYAHAVAWETHTGKPVPPGMIVRHRCDNPRCGEPSHLEIGDHGDNLSDQYLRGRRKRRTKDLWSQRES